ncbi:MAG: hypothetical protein F6J94_10700 [Moorea sp. SIO1F2]|uniref:hypothetical protein n=1 Tax=unclassified Moorena TaxID=2683338 RepID=UPI0013BD30DA|nr:MULTISPECIES: hypothetical protein [unclassified Moorena]NEO23237.1 hypothetical protein [Moorena sp. SIO4A5]NEP24557.1 hypothetical protein [Moorena sp. SIO3I6]NEQ60468.1 hypothetical protein [Moorena sp. SIO4A1]NET82384.1 hypothetical protein [Moorena sp. SIO1F2]
MKCPIWCAHCPYHTSAKDGNLVIESSSAYALRARYANSYQLSAVSLKQAIRLTSSTDSKPKTINS